MPSCPGIEGCLSMSILTSLTLPLAAWTTFSSTGPSCLQGPHHSAQKSTSTGWRFDSSITSLTKVWVVVSFTAALLAAVSLPSMVIGCRPSPLLFPGLNGVGGGVCNQEPHWLPPSCASPSSTIRGGWPVASRNLSRSEDAIVVVMVL